MTVRTVESIEQNLMIFKNDKILFFYYLFEMKTAFVYL